MWKNLFIVALGGGVGSALRYFIQESLHKRIENFAPYGTFVVNILGCLFIGLLIGLVEKEKISNPQMNLLLISGFCGGFTTFSTFAHQGQTLLTDKPWQALLYLSLSVVVGVAFAYFAYKVTKG